MKKNLGWLLLLLISIVTLGLFYMSKTATPVLLTWRIGSQMLSLIGTIWLCVSFVLSARWGFVTKLFGGIDRMYKAHHIIGGLAFVMLLHHPLFLAVEALPNTALATNYIWFSNSLPNNLGVMSLYVLLLLLLLTLVIDLPYSLWKKTHEYMGVPLIFACVHVLTITSDVSRFFPLRLWMTFTIFTGMFAAFYMRFLYEKFGPRYEYVIEKIERNNNVYILHLLEKIEKMEYKAGQFVFLKIKSLGGEYHPYSIVSSPREKYLRIAIKVLGDYTLKMDNAKEGDACVVQGPYGEFYLPMESTADIVMVAGGIGITPFVGMIRAALAKDPERKIDLFYTVRHKEDAVFYDELEVLCGEYKNFTWNLIVTDTGEHLDCTFIKDNLNELKNKKFLMCGPSVMMSCIADQLHKNKVKKTDIIYEDFSFK